MDAFDKTVLVVSWTIIGFGLGFVAAKFASPNGERRRPNRATQIQKKKASKRKKRIPRRHRRGN